MLYMLYQYKVLDISYITYRKISISSCITYITDIIYAYITSIIMNQFFANLPSLLTKIALKTLKTPLFTLFMQVLPLFTMVLLLVTLLLITIPL